MGCAAADVIIAETGSGMTRFTTVGHLASRIGACPGMNAFVGVRTPGRIRSPRPGRRLLHTNPSTLPDLHGLPPISRARDKLSPRLRRSANARPGPRADPGTSRGRAAAPPRP
ncbi:hypothetical protein ABZ896_08140 [Streptomyces sp. NPDC047072]|uniref:hypothetical protein n=1 Tax=Streptomyces sp. NPDC047072 TaxID=3154809 RepID=UPI0033E34334